jgi:hypothetical protein
MFHCISSLAVRTVTKRVIALLPVIMYYNVEDGRELLPIPCWSEL